MNIANSLFIAKANNDPSRFITLIFLPKIFIVRSTISCASSFVNGYNASPFFFTIFINACFYHHDCRTTIAPMPAFRQ